MATGRVVGERHRVPACAEDASIVVSVKKAPFHLFTFEDENMSLENVTLPAGMSDALPFARSGPCICYHEPAQRLRTKFWARSPWSLNSSRAKSGSLLHKDAGSAPNS